MKYNDNARLDTSEVSDARGGGGLGGLGGALGGLGGVIGTRGGLGGGAGLVVVVIVLLFTVFRGGGGGVSSLGGLDSAGTGTVNNTKLQDECKTGADANSNSDCAVVADINSIQDFWSGEIGKVTIGSARTSTYQPVNTVWFTGQTSTGCGAADAGAGPFYCPADKLVYIDLSFYNDIQTQFQAQDTAFVNAYVLAHEYGHHVQDLLGIESKVKTRQGATSDSVRLELQADCFAGVWAKHATEPAPNGEPALISELTDADFQSALTVAGRIGDDWIQKNLGGGQVNQDTFTHGTSAEREKWLTTGYRTGDPNACDTFGTRSLG